jgi:hypothetical protein
MDGVSKHLRTSETGQIQIAGKVIDELRQRHMVAPP